MPRRREKTSREETTDAVVFLYLLKKVDPVWGRTKIQKSAFFTELALDKAGLPGPSFRFYRYDKGPFSQELWAELNFMQGAGFIAEGIGGYALTERGDFLVELAIPDLQANNKETFEVMNAALEWCKPRTGGALIEAAYKVKIEPTGMPGEEILVKDIPLGVDIIAPDSGGLSMSPELEALIREELAMSPEALEEARRNRSKIIRESVEDLKRAIAGHERL